jgi:hypothetical protein
MSRPSTATTGLSWTISNGRSSHFGWRTPITRASRTERDPWPNSRAQPRRSILRPT